MQAMPAWLLKTRRAPSRHSRDARVYGYTITAMHKLSTPPPPRPPTKRNETYRVAFFLQVCLTESVTRPTGQNTKQRPSRGGGSLNPKSSGISLVFATPFLVVPQPWDCSIYRENFQFSPFWRGEVKKGIDLLNWLGTLEKKMVHQSLTQHASIAGRKDKALFFPFITSDRELLTYTVPQTKRDPGFKMAVTSRHPPTTIARRMILDRNRPRQKSKGFTYLQRVKTRDRSTTQIAKMSVDP